MFPGTVHAVWQDIEEGVRSRRPFPHWEQPSPDPFALLDEFMIERPGGFPMHAHVGFEKITYVLSGILQHEDGLGNMDMISAGDVHRLCAGEPTRHSELPMPGSNVHGIQLWLALAQHEVATCPGVSMVWDADKLPIETFEYGEIITISGRNSPVLLHNQTVLQDVRFQRDGWLSRRSDLQAECFFLYVIQGQVRTAGEHLTSGDVVGLCADGSINDIHGSAGAQILLAEGKQIDRVIGVSGSYVDIM